MAEPARNLPKLQSSGASPVPAVGEQRKSVVREYGEAMFVALILAIFIRTFFVQAYKIPSGSMEPTLLIGDHILVNKIGYGLRMPDSIFGLQIPGLPYGRYLFHLESVHRGDVVVFVFPPDRTKDFIKRVIGIAGDTIQVKDGVVWLNGAKMPDPNAHLEVSSSDRTAGSPRDNFGPITVPAGKLFMMGDNRDRSYDSRFWGFVDDDDVEGHATVIYWSWDGDGSSVLPIRWNRFGMIVR
ncbi:MAG: signal peptidase I [Candidatus Binatus sp.]|uniref:signal peptidase I n=1 Tax=Candidatus Binatus sp. TaxID=2811406 RepID=UPI00271F1129|nr:signal peptidase I [Candidatus Binatus sp.]MDO8431043.1 signal peptidase I [Candidatus Binatus sp.]